MAADIVPRRNKRLPAFHESHIGISDQLHHRRHKLRLIVHGVEEILAPHQLADIQRSLQIGVINLYIFFDFRVTCEYFPEKLARGKYTAAKTICQRRHAALQQAFDRTLPRKRAGCGERIARIGKNEQLCAEYG